MKTNSLSLRVYSAAFSLLFFFFTSNVFSASKISYTWTGASGDGRWETAGNWDADSDYPGSSAAPADIAIISGSYAVTATTNIVFTSSTDPEKNGTASVFNLLNGASLTTTESFGLYSASGGFTNNALVGSGSTLIIEKTLSVGAASNVSYSPTLTIQGTVTARRFNGYRATGNPGGFILDVDGGSFTITGDFYWKAKGDPGLNSLGQIIINNNGTVNIGTFATGATSLTENTDITYTTNNSIVFKDGTGSLVFGKTNYEEQSAVLSLIADSYIRLGDGAWGEFNITDLGDKWQVSVVPIPELSATVTLLMWITLGGTIGIRHRH